jgi:hypothetical protein
MMEHACQQRLDTKHCNHNNGLDNPLIGAIVAAASAPEVDDCTCMSTGMSTRCTKRQQCIDQEEDNQSNIKLEGIDVVGNFGPTIPSPPGGIDAMEADLHSRGSILAVHELEVAAYGDHDMTPPVAVLPPPPSAPQVSNNTMALGTALALPVDEILACMVPNTLAEDTLLDLYLMLLKAGSPLTSLMKLLAS